jgi:hypothetical protein
MRFCTVLGNTDNAAANALYFLLLLQITSEDPASIPKWIEVDLTGVVAGDKIDTSYFRLPEGVELWKPERPFSNGKVMGTIIGKLLLLNCLYLSMYGYPAVQSLVSSRQVALCDAAAVGY